MLITFLKNRTNISQSAGKTPVCSDSEKNVYHLGAISLAVSFRKRLGIFVDSEVGYKFFYSSYSDGQVTDRGEWVTIKLCSFTKPDWNWL